MQNSKKALFKVFISLLFTLALTHCGDLNTSQGLFFIPEKSDVNLYIKDYPALAKQMELLPLYKNLKHNYIVEDIKSRFSQNVNLFFFQIDFNLSYLTSQLNGEFIAGEINQSYYLIASVSYTAQLLGNVFQLLPGEKSESFRYKGAECHLIKRNNSSFYYAFLGNFLLVSTQKATLESMLDSASGKPHAISAYFQNHGNKHSLALHFSNTGPLSWRKLLLPNVEHTFLDFHLPTSKISVAGLSGTNPLPLAKLDSALLKKMPYETPLFYSHAEFSLDKLLTLLSQNPAAQQILNELEKKGQIKLENWKKNFANQFSLAFWGLEKGTASSTQAVIPKVSFIFTLQEKITAEEKKQLAGELKNVFQFFLGKDDWRTFANEPKDFHAYQSQTRQISFLFFKNYLALNLSNAVSSNLLNQLQKEPASLYDQFYKTLPQADQKALLLLSPEGILKDLEPLFKTYASNQGQLSRNEYENSYGFLFQYLKKLPKSALPVNFDQEKLIFAGELLEKTDQ